MKQAESVNKEDYGDEKEETETVDSLKLQDNAECISDLPDATIKEPAMESPAFVSKESVSGPEDDEAVGIFHKGVKLWPKQHMYHRSTVYRILWPLWALPLKHLCLDQTGL